MYHILAFKYRGAVLELRLSISFHLLIYLYADGSLPQTPCTGPSQWKLPNTNFQFGKSDIYILRKQVDVFNK